MDAMSAAIMTAVAASATALSSSAAFGASGAQQLGALRAPTSLNRSRIVAVRASHASESPGRSKALVALVATGAAVALHVIPVPTSSGPAIALDLNSLIDNVKELSSNIPSTEGAEGKSTAAELAKRAAQQAARDFASGDADSKTNRLLDSVKELAGTTSNSEGNQEAKNAAQDSNGDTASNLVDTVKTLSGKIPGLDGDKVVQNTAVDVAKGAASNAARDFAGVAKDRIGTEAGKALFNKFTGNN